MSHYTLLPQPPRWDNPNEGDLSPVIKTVLEYLETLRRRLQRLIAFYNSGSAVYDPPNLVDGAGTTTTVTVTGAKLGEIALCAFSLDTQGIILHPWVSATNTVSVRLQNETGGALDLASGTLTAWTFTPPQVA